MKPLSIFNLGRFSQWPWFLLKKTPNITPSFDITIWCRQYLGRDKLWLLKPHANMCQLVVRKFTNLDQNSNSKWLLPWIQNRPKWLLYMTLVHKDEATSWNTEEYCTIRKNKNKYISNKTRTYIWKEHGFRTSLTLKRIKWIKPVHQHSLSEFKNNWTCSLKKIT